MYKLIFNSSIYNYWGFPSWLLRIICLCNLLYVFFTRLHKELKFHSWFCFKIFALHLKYHLMPQACAGHVLLWFVFACKCKFKAIVCVHHPAAPCVYLGLVFAYCNLRGTCGKHHPLLFWCLNALDELKLLLEFPSHWTKLDIYNIIVVFLAPLCSSLSAEIMNYVDGRN